MARGGERGGGRYKNGALNKRKRSASCSEHPEASSEDRIGGGAGASKGSVLATKMAREREKEGDKRVDAGRQKAQTS